MHDLQYLRWKVNFQRKQIDAPADTAHSGGGAVTGGQHLISWASLIAARRLQPRTPGTAPQGSAYNTWVWSDCCNRENNAWALCNRGLVCRVNGTAAPVMLGVDPPAGCRLLEWLQCGSSVPCRLMSRYQEGSKINRVIKHQILYDCGQTHWPFTMFIDLWLDVTRPSRTGQEYSVLLRAASLCCSVIFTSGLSPSFRPNVKNNTRHWQSGGVHWPPAFPDLYNYKVRRIHSSRHSDRRCHTTRNYAIIIHPCRLKVEQWLKHWMRSTLMP